MQYYDAQLQDCVSEDWTGNACVAVKRSVFSILTKPKVDLQTGSEMFHFVANELSQEDSTT